jgi:hypothetical protein
VKLPDRDNPVWLYMSLSSIASAMVLIAVLLWVSAFAAGNTLLLAENVLLFVIAVSVAISASLYHL